LKTANDSCVKPAPAAKGNFDAAEYLKDNKIIEKLNSLTRPSLKKRGFYYFGFFRETIEK